MLLLALALRGNSRTSASALADSWTLHRQPHAGFPRPHFSYAIDGGSTQPSETRTNATPEMYHILFVSIQSFLFLYLIQSDSFSHLLLSYHHPYGAPQSKRTHC